MMKTNLHTDKKVKMDIQDSMAVLTINNPPVNTLSTPTMQDLKEAFTEVEKHPDVKVVLLRGSNGHFMAGAELNEFNEIETRDKATEASYLGYQLMDKIESFSKPVIALIEGACLGGGLELALACHIRLGAANSVYGFPEITLGLIPGAGGTQRLPKVVGLSKAKRMILTGERIGPEEAEQLGILDGVYPEEQLFEEARKLADNISRHGSTSISYALRAINTGFLASAREGYRVEAELFGACFETEDKKERVRRFLEKKHK
ncbi:MAG: enoyl-CoA hydratase/isomerase family protein [Bacillaceae bacterium]|nr:enoyl-CoA hydratase/isomerase family protein [Bacillaceae bacterium]